jgi:preprotein translocase subunit YajC
MMQLNPFPKMLALTPPPANGQGGQPQNPLVAFLPMILLVVIFYFILIRPQQKRAKEQRKMLEAIKSGDKVVTSSGIVGEVITVKERTISLRSADAKLEVTKESIVAITESKS